MAARGALPGAGRLRRHARPGRVRAVGAPAGRSVADEVDDVVAIADHLGFERFGVSGGSGGGPHALGTNICTLDSMMLAGTPVADASVLALARLVREAGFDDTAERLEHAYDVECKVLALTIPDREAIVRALEECPDGLAELRGVLVREHEWRVREGLV